MSHTIATVKRLTIGAYLYSAQPAFVKVLHSVTRSDMTTLTFSSRPIVGKVLERNKIRTFFYRKKEIESKKLNYVQYFLLKRL